MKIIASHKLMSNVVTPVLLLVVLLLVVVDSSPSLAQQQNGNNNNDVYVLQKIIAPVLLGADGDSKNNVCSEVWTDPDICSSSSSSSRVKCNTQNRITHLKLSQCKLSGTLPVAISQLAFLSVLELQENSLTGHVPGLAWFNTTTTATATAPLPPLTKIRLNRNKLTGNLPSEFSRLAETLTYIDLSKNSFTGSIPRSWAALKNLHTVEIGYNNLQGGDGGGLPSEWGSQKKMKSLYQIGIRYNSNLGGGLPEEWGGPGVFPKLGYLRMQDCGLTGEIPESWGDLGKDDGGGSSSLIQLSLHSNKLTGPLPKRFSEFTNLKKMWLYGNELSGPLPPEWGNGLKKLQILVLNSLKLTGPLPDEWSGMEKLQTLDLRDNLLVGNAEGSGVPPSWKTLRDIRGVDLSGNCVPPLSFSSTSSDEGNYTSISSSTTTTSAVAVPATTTAAPSPSPSSKQQKSGLDDILSAPNLLLFDFTPGCFKMPPADTKVSMSTPYMFRKVNPWNWQDASACHDLFEDRECDLYPFEIQIQRWPDGSFRIAFYCRGHSIVFQDSCITSMFTPALECFVDENATIPCNSNTVQYPSWQNVLSIVPALPSGKLFFTEIKDALLFHGVFYRMTFKFGFNFYNKSYVEMTKLTELFQARSCPLTAAMEAALRATGEGEESEQVVANGGEGEGDDQQNTNQPTTSRRSQPQQGSTTTTDEKEVLIDRSGNIAVNYSTSCISCPQFAFCDGTTVARVGSIPAWRVAPGLLPFYECPKSTRVGCQSRLRQQQTNNSASSSSSSSSSSSVFASLENISDGAGCQPNYEGPLCARCSIGFRKTGGTCQPCLSLPVQIGYFAVGAVILVVGAAILVVFSLKPKRKAAKTATASRSAAAAGELVLLGEGDNGSMVSMPTLASISSNANMENDNDDEQQQLEQTRPSSSSSSPASTPKASSDKKKKKNGSSSVAAASASSSSVAASASAVVDDLIQGMCSPVLKKLEQHRSKIESLVIIMRALVNHFSLVGALRGTTAAEDVGAHLRSFLDVQQSGNNLAFGSFASTLSCSMPRKWSPSVLHFNLIWMVVAGVFLLEAVVFFAAFRRKSVAVTTILFLCFLGYAPLTTTATKLLGACSSLKFYKTDAYLVRNFRHPVTVINILSSDPEQNCDDPEFQQYRVFAALTIALFSFGFPLLIVFCYKKMANNLRMRETLFGFFTKNVSEEAYYWEILVLPARKLTVALSLGALYGSSALQLQFFTVICAVMLSLSIGIKPMTSAAANHAEQLSILSAIICASFISLVSTFPGTAMNLAAAISIVVTQVVAVLALIFYSHRAVEQRAQQKDNNNNNDNNSGSDAAASRAENDDSSSGVGRSTNGGSSSSSSSNIGEGRRRMQKNSSAINQINLDDDGDEDTQIPLLLKSPRGNRDRASSSSFSLSVASPRNSSRAFFSSPPEAVKKKVDLEMI